METLWAITVKWARTTPSYSLSPLSFQRNSLILLHGHLRGFGMSWLVYTLSEQCGIYKLYILCRLYKVYKLYKLYRLSKAYRLYNLSGLYMLYLKLLGHVGYISYSNCTVYISWINSVSYKTWLNDNESIDIPLVHLCFRRNPLMVSPGHPRDVKGVA